MNSKEALAGVAISKAPLFVILELESSRHTFYYQYNERAAGMFFKISPFVFHVRKSHRLVTTLIMTELSLNFYL